MSRDTFRSYGKPHMSRSVASMVHNNPYKGKPEPLGLNNIYNLGQYRGKFLTVREIFQKDRDFFERAVKQGLFKQPTPQELIDLCKGMDLIQRREIKGEVLAMVGGAA